MKAIVTRIEIFFEMKLLRASEARASTTYCSPHGRFFAGNIMRLRVTLMRYQRRQPFPTEKATKGVQEAKRSKSGTN